jgi:hypothetical protein
MPPATGPHDDEIPNCPRIPFHSHQNVRPVMPPRRRRRGDLAFAAAVVAVTAAAVGAVAGSNGGAEFDYRKLSGIIIPGFASTQLRAWSVLDCPYSPFDFNPLDSVWLDTGKVRLPTTAPFHLPVSHSLSLSLSLNPAFLVLV